MSLTGPIEAPASQSMNLQNQLETTAHNLANATTVGYKRRVNVFAAALARQLAGGGQAANDGQVVNDSLSDTLGAGNVAPSDFRQQAATMSQQIDFTQGPLQRTDRPLDLALHGKGFFVLESPDGLTYTRNGQFRLNRLNQLVDTSGRLVAGTEGPITVPQNISPSEVQINAAGEVIAGDQPLGTLRLASFADTRVLRPAGDSGFRAPPDVRPSAATDCAVRRGHLEQSNVKTVPEMVNLIEVTRMYEANMKSIRTADDRVKNLLQVAMS